MLYNLSIYKIPILVMFHILKLSEIFTTLYKSFSKTRASSQLRLLLVRIILRSKRVNNEMAIASERACKSE